MSYVIAFALGWLAGRASAAVVPPKPELDLADATRRWEDEEAAAMVRQVYEARRTAFAVNRMVHGG